MLKELEIIREMKVLKLDRGKWETGEESVIMEHPFVLFGNGEEIRRFNCTPQEVEELSVGALFAMGKIKNREDLISLRIDSEKKKGMPFTGRRNRRSASHLPVICQKTESRMPSA